MTTALDAALDAAMAEFEENPIPREAIEKPATIRFFDLSEETPTIDWIQLVGMDGFLARQLTLLLYAPPKAGKTTLIYGAAKEWVSQGLRVLVLTEEPEPAVAPRCRQFGLYPPLFRVAGPTGCSWKALLAGLQEEEFDVLVLDTARYWFNLPPEGENDSATVQKYLKPLQMLTRDKGAALVVLHHARKSGGTDGTAAAGTTAWVGMVDVATQLSRSTSVETQRILSSVSRVSAQSSVVVNLTPEGYVALGLPEEAATAALEERLVEVLEDGVARTPDTLAGLVDASAATVRRVANKLFNEGRLARTGKGRRGDPHYYALACVAEPAAGR